MDSPEEKMLKAYNLYSDEIFRFGLFKLSDREKAKDVLQETFMKTWIYISKGGEIDNIRAFLYKTASNTVIDEYRRQSRTDNKLESLESLSEYGFDPGFDDIESLIYKIDGKQAMSLINQLPEIYSEVLFLRYSGNQSVPEIAEILEQTENAISVRINRGIKKLKEIYNKKNTEK
jgi:RNA polymerase sigma-70 factor (ECF subfamily)